MTQSVKMEELVLHQIPVSVGTDIQAPNVKQVCIRYIISS